MKHGTTQVGVRALKASLSRYLAEVERGGIVTVTHRGKVVARIVPGQGDTQAARAEPDADLATFDRIFPGKPKPFDVRAFAVTPARPGRKRSRIARAILDERR
jgi:prevent-host-death family protein